MPSDNRDAFSSTTNFRSRIRSCTALMMTSRRPLNRNGFASGGVSGVRSLPKSIPRPAPTSVLLPLFAGVRSLPLSLTRSFCLSTPFAACARTGSEQASNNTRPMIMRDISAPHFTNVNVQVFPGDTAIVSLSLRFFEVAFALPLPQSLNARFKVTSVVIKIVCSVVAIRIAHVIQVIRSRRIQCGFQRTLAWRSNRSWRQSGINSRVVRRPPFNVAAIDLPVVAPLALKLRCVDDARVNCEGNLFLQTIVDDGRNQRPLFSELRFRLYQRCSGDDLSRRHVQTACAVAPLGFPHAAKPFHHYFDQLLGSGLR